jgi:hypothetical protein
MSLTSFLKNKDVKDAFNSEFQRPKLSYKEEIIAPPLTKNYSIVGIAFDYLLRFYIKYLNPDAIVKNWVSEKSLLFLDLFKTDDQNYKKAEKIIKTSKLLYEKYIADGILNNKLLRSILLLSKLDIIYRTNGKYNLSLDDRELDRKDIIDLKNLISIVNPSIFKAKNICLLNPTFGEASRLVSGADADLIIDDTIIEIKTVKQVALNSDYFNQAIGYYILSELCENDHIIRKCNISKIGIYFSRYAFLYLIDLDTIIKRNTFLEFKNWFKKRAIAGNKNNLYSGSDLKIIPPKIRKAVKSIINFNDEKDFTNKIAAKLFSFSITNKILILNFQFLPKKKLLDFKKIIKAEGLNINGEEKSVGNPRCFNARYLIEINKKKVVP